MKDIDVIDLFDEEIKKKEQKLNKRVERMRLREEKQKEREYKELERYEDQAFDQYLKQLKEEKLVEIPTKNNSAIDNSINIKVIEKKLDQEEPVIKEKKRVSTVLITILSICLLVISGDYIIYNSVTNYKDLTNLINSIILIVTVIFYLLSIVVKKDGVKRLFIVFSLLSFIGFMAYHLFII